MDNPNYGSSHNSPALVVFSQAANGLSDALRIQRPFHSQVSNPFTTQAHNHQPTGYGQFTDSLMRNGSKSIFQLSDAKDLQHLSLVSGHHFLHGFQPHFLHHPLNPAMVSNGTNGSLFGGGGAFVKPFPSNLALPSAFTPPKCLGFGLDQGLIFGGTNNNNNNNSMGGGSESFRTSESSSPACVSLSPPAKDEPNELQSEDGDRSGSICSPERQETPGFRKIQSSNKTAVEALNLCLSKVIDYRKNIANYYANSDKNGYYYSGIGPKSKLISDAPSPNSCPICGQHLASNELESHFSTELSRLAKFNSYSQRHELRRSLSSEMHALQNSLQGRNSRWETFQRIQTNRQSRLRAKLRKRKFDETDFPQLPNNCQACPVCQMRLQRTHEEVVQHIEDCIRKQHHVHQQQPLLQQDEDETVDVESYGDGDETSNSSLQTTQMSNLSPKLETNINCLKRMSEEPMITSLNSSNHNLHHHQQHHQWDRKSRLMLPLSTTISTENSITRVTPTSSDQKIDMECDTEKMIRDKSSNMKCANNAEEVIIDNTDDEDCIKRRINLPHREERKSTEEATSSVEIDSVTDPNTNNSSLNLSSGVTPNSESYVSTSETTDPASKAQVLEELKARIRELEGSPHYKCFICKELCNTLVISKICGHYLCEDCWITESDTKKSCPRCKTVSFNNDFRKIHV